MSGTLLAIYVVAAWASHGGGLKWHEFQLSQHFFSRNVCEHYRPRLVAKWIADPNVPFHRKDVVSTRCGAWEADPDEGLKL